MKLSRVKVKNLGPIREAEIPGAPVVLFLGPNEAGKSTLLDSLQVLVFGTRGRVPVKENKALIRDGEDSWVVEAVLEGDDAPPLRATPSQRPLRATLEPVFGDPRVWRALGDAGTFLDLSPTARRELLADLAARDTSSLADLLEGENAPADVVALIREGRVKTAHKQIQEQRRTQARWVKELTVQADKAPEAPMVPVKGGDRPVDQVPADAVQNAVAKLERQLAEVQAASGALRQYELVKRDAEEARKELEGMKAEVTWEDGDERALAKLRQDAGVLRSEIATAQASASHWAREIDRITELLQDGGDCPTCGAKLKADASRKRLNSLQTAAKGAFNEHRARQKECVEKIEAIEKQQKEQEERRRLAQQSATYRQRLESRIQAFERLDAPKAASASAEAITVELDRLRGIQRARATFDQAVQQHEQAKGRLGAAKEKLDTWARWEQLTDPAKMEDTTAIGDFREALLATATKLLGSGDQVLLEDDFRVTVRGRDPSLASDSCRIRAGAACAIALARVAGVGFLAVDRFESLDDAGRKAFLGACKLAIDAGWLNHVWIAAVKQDPKAGANVPWLAWVKVEDGTTVRMNGRA